MSGMLILPHVARSQALNGSVVGNINDPSGAAVPGAAVTLTSNTTNQSRAAVSDAQGGYNFATVQPGVYTVRVSKPGFATVQRGNVTVAADGIMRVDLMLTVGGVNQTVQVEAETPPLQTDSGEVRSELSSQDLQNMPVYVGRNYQTLLSDLPGFTPMQNDHSVGSNPSRSLYFSANGGDTYENNIRVDGSELMNMWLTDIAALNPTLESIESVNVATGSFDADSGFAGGANVSVQTKSGTNEPHGALFEDYTGDALEARPFFLPSNQGKGKEVYNDFGAAMGYRIIKNKLFFFGSYEGDRIHDYSNLLQTIPDALQRSGNMSESGTAMYDPATGSCERHGPHAIPQ